MELLLHPIAYPRPKEVKQRLSTAIKSPIVSISRALLSENPQYVRNDEHTSSLIIDYLCTIVN